MLESLADGETERNEPSKVELLLSTAMLYPAVAITCLAVYKWRDDNWEPKRSTWIVLAIAVPFYFTVAVNCKSRDIGILLTRLLTSNVLLDDFLRSGCV